MPLFAITPLGIARQPGARAIRHGWDLLDGETFTTDAESIDGLVLAEDRVSLRAGTPEELAPLPQLTPVGIVRFAATPPLSVLENVGLGPVTRIVKGRWRVSFDVPLPTDSYCVLASVEDAAVRNIRCTLRTATHCEVRVTDAGGLAADAKEVTVKVERVVVQNG